MAGLNVAAYGAYNNTYSNVFAPGTVRGQVSALNKSGALWKPDKDAGGTLPGAYNTTLKNTAALLSGMKNLSAAAAPLKSGSAGLWNSGKAVSSNANVLTASMDGRKTSLSYDVTVNRTAAAQRSESAALAGGGSGGFAAGRNDFTLKTGGRAYALSADIGEDDTNQSALGKFADAVNKSGSGVTASVVTEGDDAKLVLTGKTGEQNGFTVEGLDTVKTQDARDASYSMYGRDYASATNTVKIADGRIALELKSAGTATVTTRTDAAKAADAFVNFANAYNTSVKNLVDMPPSRQLNAVQSKLSVSNYDSAQLSKLGVTVNSDRTLSVDAGKLAEAIDSDPGRAQRLFTELADRADDAFRGAQALKYTPQTDSYLVNYLQSGLSAGLSGGLVLDLFA